MMSRRDCRGRAHCGGVVCAALLAARALADVPLPSPQQLSWTKYEVSLMISYDMITQLPGVPNPQAGARRLSLRPVSGTCAFCVCLLDLSTILACLFGVSVSAGASPAGVVALF